MKKLLTVLLACLLVLGLTAVSSGNRTEAQNGYPDIPNARVDGNGLLTWSDVPGTDASI